MFDFAQYQLGAWLEDALFSGNAPSRPSEREQHVREGRRPTARKVAPLALAFSVALGFTDLTVAAAPQSNAWLVEQAVLAPEAEQPSENNLEGVRGDALWAAVAERSGMTKERQREIGAALLRLRRAPRQDFPIREVAEEGAS